MVKYPSQIFNNLTKKEFYMKKQHFFSITVITLFVVVMGLSGCNQDIPKVDFTSDKTQGTVPLTVQFTDNSTITKSLGLEFLNIEKCIQLPKLTKANSINRWEWNFGDGNNSSEKNPIHVYTTPGQYTVSLTVTTNSGKTNTATKQNYINAVANTPTEGEGGSEGSGEGTTEGSTEGTSEGATEGETPAGNYVWETGENWKKGL